MSRVDGHRRTQGPLRLAAIALVFVAGACAAPPPPPPTQTTGQGAGPAAVDAQSEVAALSAEIQALGPGVAAPEATRAAQVALSTSRQLAVEYGVTDPPLIHNTKVNMGLRPRGLCYHWADDLEARLRQEGFETLQLHRAIANSDNPFRIEHSTVILSRKGDPMARGVVLDPWRAGGDLFWAPMVEDTSYAWIPRSEVFAAKRAKREAVTQDRRGQP